MKTVITLIVHHKEPIASLAEKIAGRAYSMQHVELAEVVVSTTSNDLITLPVIEMPEEVKG